MQSKLHNIGAATVAALLLTVAIPFVALAQPTVASPKDLSSGSWTRTGLASITHGQSDPDGGTSGDLITEDGSVGAHWITQSMGSVVTGIPIRARCRVKAGTSGSRGVVLNPSGGNAYINPTTGAVTSQTGLTSVTVTAQPDGWWLVDLVVTSCASSTMLIGLSSSPGVASYAGDGTSNARAYFVEAEQDRVGQWTDRSGAGNHVVQATVANQPRWIQSALNGRPGLVFDGVDDRLDATTVANWKFLHDGTRCTVVAVLKPTLAASVGALLTTGGRSAPITGWLLDYHGASQRLELYISNGAAAIVSTTASASSTLRGVPHVISYRYLEGGGTDYDVRSDGVSVLSGSTTGAPSSGNPTVPLRLMSRDNAAYFCPGDVYEIAAYTRYLDDATLSSITQHLGGKWGIAVTP